MVGRQSLPINVQGSQGDTVERTYMQYTVVTLLLTLIELYWWVIVGMAVMSWLIAFEVVNMRAQAVFSIWRALNALTEPALRPIRILLPPIGGLDLSPLVLLFALSFLRNSLIAAIGRMI
jgi:YggT family protein